MAENQAEQAAMSNVQNLLRSLIGNRADEIAQNLKNFNLKEIRLNGEMITTQRLYEIIDSYQNQTIEISELVLQSTQN